MWFCAVSHIAPISGVVFPVRYILRFVHDDALPEKQAFAVAESDGDVYAFIKWGGVSDRVLAEAWAAYRKLAAPKVPEQRHLRSAV